MRRCHWRALEVVPTACQAAAKCSSRTDRATLLSSGERIPPCGVPVTVSRSTPSSVRMPALQNAFTKPRTRLSAIRCRTRAISAVWSISSKQAVMSPSSTHS